MCGKEVAESMELDLDSWLHQHIRPQGGSHSLFRYQVCSILQFKNQIEFYVYVNHCIGLRDSKPSLKTIGEQESTGEQESPFGAGR